MEMGRTVGPQQAKGGGTTEEEGGRDEEGREGKKPQV